MSQNRLPTHVLIRDRDLSVGELVKALIVAWRNIDAATQTDLLGPKVFKEWVILTTRAKHIPNLYQIKSILKSERLSNVVLRYVGAKWACETFDVSQWSEVRKLHMVDVSEHQILLSDELLT